MAWLFVCGSRDTAWARDETAVSVELLRNLAGDGR